MSIALAVDEIMKPERKIICFGCREEYFPCFKDYHAHLDTPIIPEYDDDAC